MGAIKEIMRFQTDRELHFLPFDSNNENANILEEMFEAGGFDVDKKDRPKLKEMFAQFECDVLNEGVADNHTCEPHFQADAYCDIIVFAIGALMKLGYDPELALQETAKEINSRVGTMVDGKFEKDLSPEAKANWYKADYSVAIDSY